LGGGGRRYFLSVDIIHVSQGRLIQRQYSGDVENIYLNILQILRYSKFYQKRPSFNYTRHKKNVLIDFLLEHILEFSHKLLLSFTFSTCCSLLKPDSHKGQILHLLSPVKIKRGLAKFPSQYLGQSRYAYTLILHVLGF